MKRKKAYVLKVKEFDLIPFKREEDYFEDGYASWELTWKNKKWYVFANYESNALLKNETTKDAFNGIISFELWNDKNHKIRKFKIDELVVDNQIKLNIIEQFIMQNC